MQAVPVCEGKQQGGETYGLPVQSFVQRLQRRSRGSGLQRVRAPQHLIRAVLDSVSWVQALSDQLEQLVAEWSPQLQPESNRKFGHG